MLLTPESVLGISEIDPDLLREARRRNIIEVPGDGFGGEMWDEFDLLAAVVIERLGVGLDSLKPHLDQRLSVAFHTFNHNLWISQDGNISGRIHEGIALEPEFDFINEELEPLYGEAPF